MLNLTMRLVVNHTIMNWNSGDCMIEKVTTELFNIEKKNKVAFQYSQYVLDSLVLKDSNYYIPARSWNTRDSGINHSRLGSGEVRWETPYVREIYLNPNYNFSTDKNPNARGLWFEEAKANNLKQWLDDSQKAARSKY